MWDYFFNTSENENNSLKKRDNSHIYLGVTCIDESITHTFFSHLKRDYSDSSLRILNLVVSGPKYSSFDEPLRDLTLIKIKRNIYNEENWSPKIESCNGFIYLIDLSKIHSITDPLTPLDFDELSYVNKVVNHIKDYTSHNGFCTPLKKRPKKLFVVFVMSSKEQNDKIIKKDDNVGDNIDNESGINSEMRDQNESENENESVCSKLLENTQRTKTLKDWLMQAINLHKYQTLDCTMFFWDLKEMNPLLLCTDILSRYYRKENM